MRLKWASFFICCCLTVSTADIESHSLKFLSTWRSSPGENHRQFEQVTVFDGITIASCRGGVDGLKNELGRIVEPSDKLSTDCKSTFYDILESLPEISQNVNNTVDVVQRERGCTWNTSGLVSSFEAWALNGMDFLTFDPHTLKWSSHFPEAASIEQSWNSKKMMNHVYENFINNYCPQIRIRANSQAKHTTDLRVFAKPVPNQNKLSLRCHVTTSDLSISKVLLIGDGAFAANHVTVTQPLPGGDGLIIIRLTAEISKDTDKKYGCMVQTNDHNISVPWDGKTLNGTNINIYFVKSEHTLLRNIFLGILGCIGAAVASFVYCYVKVYRPNRAIQTFRSPVPFEKEEFDQMMASGSRFSPEMRMILATMYFRGNIPEDYKYIEEEWLKMMNLREREEYDPDFFGPAISNSRDT